jgi:hypothetical protein
MAEPTHMATSTADASLDDKARGVLEDLDNVRQQETDQLLAALQLSKCSPPPLNSDGVVLLRLTRMARSVDVVNLLVEAPTLAACRARVTDAGCDITPDWACGAKLFVPCTSEQVDELELQGIELSEHHILALLSDKETIEDALKALPHSRRPRLSEDHRANKQNGLADEVVVADEREPLLIVEHFLGTDSSVGFPSWSP